MVARTGLAPFTPSWVVNQKLLRVGVLYPSRSGHHGKDRQVKDLTDRQLWEAAAQIAGCDPEDHEDDEQVQPIFDALKTLAGAGVRKVLLSDE